MVSLFGGWVREWSWLFWRWVGENVGWEIKNACLEGLVRDRGVEDGVGGDRIRQYQCRGKRRNEGVLQDVVYNVVSFPLTQEHYSIKNNNNNLKLSKLRPYVCTTPSSPPQKQKLIKLPPPLANPPRLPLPIKHTLRQALRPHFIPLFAPRALVLVLGRRALRVGRRLVLRGRVGALARQRVGCGGGGAGLESGFESVG